MILEKDHSFILPTMGGFRINTHTNCWPPFLESTPGRFARVIRGVPAVDGDFTPSIVEALARVL
jgi:hypothetical protein